MIALLSLLLLLLIEIVETCNIVIEWNNIALDAIRHNASSPPVASRALAIVNVAMHDAVASIDKQYQAHNYSVADAPSTASLEAAALAAAHLTLVFLFPNQAATFNARAKADQIAFANANAPAVLAGIDVGSRVARAVIEHRAHDGTQIYKPYPGSNEPGKWRPTPPSFAAAESPQFATQTPWCLTSDDEFRPPPPPDIGSAIYIADHNQIATLGAKFNSTRTAEQTAIAQFWYNGPASDTPPGTWQVVAETEACLMRFDLPSTTRLFSLVAMALADAAIMGWDAKYTYGQWRPVTAIQFANTAPPTQPPLAFDPNWQPFLSTPPWPDYLSDRAMFGGAASQVLIRVFGSDVPVTVEADGLHVSRTFRNFAEAAFEQGQSRVFGGSHFNTSCVMGVEYGKKVGNWAFENCLQKKQSTASSPTSSPSTGTTINNAKPASSSSSLSATRATLINLLTVLWLWSD